MAWIHDLKPRFQAMVRPILHALARAGVTPNRITGVAMAGSLLAGAGLMFARKRPSRLLILRVWPLALMYDESGWPMIAFSILAPLFLSGSQ